MQFAIETKIPMPAKPVPGGKYPFAALKVGDSFVVNLGGKKSWAFIFTAMNMAQRKYGIKLTTRILDDGNRRVWRTA